MTRLFSECVMVAIALSPEITLHARVLLGLLTAMWIFWIADEVLANGLSNSLGVRPRSEKGLMGILMAPLLHGNFRHLSSNTVVFAVMGGLVLLRSFQDFVIVTLVAWVVSGSGTWLFGNPRTNHVGASGVVFGYLGFLLLRGYFERSVGAIALSLLVALAYGQLIWLVLPIRSRMSWQMHLFGFVGGVLVARFLPELRSWTAPWFSLLMP